MYASSAQTDHCSLDHLDEVNKTIAAPINKATEIIGYAGTLD
jgi:hypothetical protein